jgi:ectoine hydroxylase-related dioxygenase (phytanoyl-CoA dioxygenase family)
MVTPAHADFFAANGYVLVEGLFDAEEVSSLIDHFMEIRKKPTPMDDAGLDKGDPKDPLKQFPRIIHPHRWDERTFQWMLDPRLRDTMTTILGAEPIAGQTMMYFKPAGARGQALHQDQKYLRVSPGTCVAAWLALDDCDDENGCLQVVPGTHNFELVCTTHADTSQSFTMDTTPLPPGYAPVPVHMKAGDVLFFNGSLVHGSGPNLSQDRFRRSLIGHYLTADAEQVTHFYTPAYRFDGSIAEVEASDEGGPCGIWVEKDGKPELEMVSDRMVAAAGPH